MKRTIIFALSAALALSLTACGAVPKESAGGEEPAVIGGDSATWGPDLNGEEDVQLPNPFTEYDSLEEAAEAAGFSMTVPETVDGCSERVFRVLGAGGEDAMLEVICRDGEAGEREVRIRKAPGAEDISGDYNQYAQSETVDVGGLEVTMRGDNGLVRLAAWTADGCTYSLAVYGGDGISSGDMAALAAEVR